MHINSLLFVVYSFAWHEKRKLHASCNNYKTFSLASACLCALRDQLILQSIKLNQESSEKSWADVQRAVTHNHQRSNYRENITESVIKCYV